MTSSLEEVMEYVPRCSGREHRCTNLASIHYIAEANQKLVLGDMRGLVIDLAIAVETLIRRLIGIFISDRAAPQFEDMVGRISIGQMIGKWSRLGFSSSSWAHLEKEIGLVKHVIDYRNGIMHRGEYPKIGGERASELLRAVLAFVVQGEREMDNQAP